jgi:hypothetical protein
MELGDIVYEGAAQGLDLDFRGSHLVQKFVH